MPQRVSNWGVGKVCVQLLVGALVLFPVHAHAEPLPASGRPMALGIQLDLLPTVLSAVDGKAGYAPQVWLGVGHVRIRLISAHLQLPDAIAAAPK
ncbi:MAG TPA: hypothetical protein VI299_20355, partial [Polyangiales bacterium]